MRFASALALAGALGLTLVPRTALAHCDTLDGPVVKDARVALDAKDVTPVLKWVSHEEEGEIREAFQHALGVRALGPEARALADRFFGNDRLLEAAMLLIGTRRMGRAIRCRRLFLG